MAATHDHRMSSKTENKENLTRQGSMRRVLASEHNKASFLSGQNEDINKIYKIYRQEYIILAEYKMIQSENLEGVYVIPSKESALLWFGVIFVRRGPYEDGIFRFNIVLDENFPESDYPKVIFQCNTLHPVIHPETNELHLKEAFPTWKKNEQHIWQILKYIQWIFNCLDASLAHAVNKDIAEMYKNNKDAFIQKTKEIVLNSKERVYDDPPTEDKHYIRFEPFNVDVHSKVKAQMMNFQDEEHIGARSGLSWVLPGSFKALTRPPSPQSESES